MWHLSNFVGQLVFDYVLIKTFGVKPLVYLIMSSFFAGSLHPCAGHFIAEHYLWDGMEQETFSYYGPLNVLAYNVGSMSRLNPSFIDGTFNRLAITTNITISPPSHGHDSPPSALWLPNSMILSPRILHGQW